MDECKDSPSGLHYLTFLRQELLGVTLWNIYSCEHCKEELWEAAEDKDKGRDCSETYVEV